MKIILILLFGFLSQVTVAQKPYMSVQDRLDVIDSVLALNQVINGKVLTDSLVLTADDILGLDDSFIDPHDFQIGQYLKVAVVGDDTVFVAESIPDPDTTKRMVLLLQDTAASRPGNYLYFKVLYNTSGAIITNIANNDGSGWYIATLSTSYLTTRSVRSNPVQYIVGDPSTDPMPLVATVLAFDNDVNNFNIRSVDSAYDDGVFPNLPVILTIYFIHD